MSEIYISLAISATEYQAIYSRPGYVVSTVSMDGRTVRFPANILQPFVEHRGIHGRFCIRFNSAGKFQGISRV